MIRHRFLLFALGAIVACSSQGGSAGDTRGGLSEGDGEDAGGEDAGGEADSAATDAGTEADGAAPDAGPPGRLTPSNLPADICDSGGTTDLNVPAGTSTTIDTNVYSSCDAVVYQTDNLPAICVRKYANVTIGGTLLLKSVAGAPLSPVAAIVATHAFTIDPGGTIDAAGLSAFSEPRPGREAPGAPDSRGEPSGEYFFGQGAGHVTPGAVGVTGGIGGSAYGPTTGAQLAAGARGANGYRSYNPPGQGGFAGGAVQIVSCGELRLSGSVTANGSVGGVGSPSVGAGATGGGGGGSGGTVVVEAARISGTGAKLAAVGGNGGEGGYVFRGYCTPGAGGAGGGSSPPQPGEMGTATPDGRYCGGGGGGGAAGRVVINVPQGVSVPAIAAEPPAAIGVIGTH